MVNFTRTPISKILHLHNAYLGYIGWIARVCVCAHVRLCVCVWLLHKAAGLTGLQLPRRNGIRYGPASRTGKPFKGDILVNAADAANLSSPPRYLFPYYILPYLPLPSPVIFSSFLYRLQFYCLSASFSSTFPSPFSPLSRVFISNPLHPLSLSS